MTKSEDKSSEQNPEKKGKATPKRKDAVAKTKINSITAPVSKADRTKNRESLKSARAEARAAYMRGDQSALPARDRGPVKKFVRDYIDSRRSLGEYCFASYNGSIGRNKIFSNCINVFSNGVLNYLRCFRRSTN